MVSNPEFRIYKITIWYFIFPISIGILITLLSYPAGLLSVHTMTYVFAYAFSVGIPYMKLTEFIEWKLENHIPWLRRPFKRLVLSVLFKVTSIIIILIIVNYIIFIIIRNQNMDELYERTYEGIKYAVVCIIIATFIANSILFFRSWRQSALNEEILKREQLTSEYEALKNQINPHFLFNNLTTLTSLIYQDKEKAVLFVKEFSNVFRHILEFNKADVVDLSTELKLLDSFVYLYKIRFENSLFIKTDLATSGNKYIIPMTLQMLLENAIKHNRISQEDPLHITITEENDYILIRNDRKPKSPVIKSQKIGLENIKSQYAYYTDRKVIIEKTDKAFCVKVPILTSQKK